MANLQSNKHFLDASLGRTKADLVLKNGFVLNVFSSEIIKADVAICGNTIVGVGEYSGKNEIDCTGKYITPGLIDAHMHMESSMLLPGELSKVLVQAGTTTIIADPHEAVNVSGTKALDYLLKATEKTLCDIYIMVPSSVPASDNDVNGCGEFTAGMMKKYVHNPRVLGLGETMRYSDVINAEERMEEKINLFKNNNMKIDGHFPGGSGKELQAYRLSGVQDDHESTTKEEALEKLRSGIAVFIREGSGAKNVEAVVKGLLEEKVSLTNCMFCTDDKHTAEIKREGHISTCVAKAIALGVPAVQAYRMATIQTAQFYGLRNCGAVAAGYKADILILNKIGDIHPEKIIKNGILLTIEDFSKKYDMQVPKKLCHTVYVANLTKEKIAVKLEEKNKVIEMLPGQLLTNLLYEKVNGAEGFFTPDSTYNKICVVERHNRTHTAAACPVKGFGICKSAVATSVSHDAHNIIACGDNDDDILNAVECIKEMQGGYAISSGGKIIGKLPLKLFGLMSLDSSEQVEKTLSKMLEEAQTLGVKKGIDPFINLSFMALTVIPKARITDKGIVVM